MAQATSTEPIAYLRAIRRRWPVIVLLAIIGLGVGYVTAKPSAASSSGGAAGAAPTSYQATDILLLLGSGNGPDPSGLSLDAMALFTTTGKVPRMVAAQLGYKGDPAALAGEVSATADTSIGALKITSTQPSAARATRVVSAFGSQLVAYLDAQIQATNARELASTSSQLTSLTQQITTLQAKPSSSVTDAEVKAALAQYQTEYGQYEQLLAAPKQTTLTAIQAPVAEPVSAGKKGASHKTTIPAGRKARTALGGAVG
ncbi:MAG: hypothetical protein ACRDZQ_11710, partial [Acidimicrobiales bacterium]